MRSVENAEKMKKSLDIGNRPEKKIVGIIDN